ncbi:GAF domain-containing protein [Nocardia brasiliensis]
MSGDRAAGSSEGRNLAPTSGTPRAVRHPGGHHRRAKEGWVLIETMSGEPSVILENGRVRQFGHTNRARIAGSANVAAQLDDVLCRVRGTAHPVRRPIRLASSLLLQIVGVPVVGPDDQVYAIQLWVGRVNAGIPARLPVGILSLDPRTGIAHGCEISRKTEKPEITGTSVLPRLLTQLDSCDDRAGLLGLMSAPAGRRWIGTATSSGPIRRHLCIAARCCDSAAGPIVRIIVCDITEVQPPAPMSLDIGVLRRMPVPVGHAAGLVDVRSGLLHEWIVPGPPPLHHWLTEIPQIHPDDAAELQRCRKALIGGATSAECLFRVRFGDDKPWTRVEARWIAVPCDDAPQALLDITLHKPRSRLSPPIQPSDK